MPQVSNMDHSYLTTHYHFFLWPFHSSKMGSKVRAAPRRKISDLGFLSDLARVVVSGPRRMVTSSNAGTGCAAARTSPVLERVQRRHDALQCVEINTVRRFGHTRSRKVTNPARRVRSALRHGENSSPGNGEVTFQAFGVPASLVAENQQSSMRKTSKLTPGWC